VEITGRELRLSRLPQFLRAQSTLPVFPTMMKSGQTSKPLYEEAGNLNATVHGNLAMLPGQQLAGRNCPKHVKLTPAKIFSVPTLPAPPFSSPAPVDVMLSFAQLFAQLFGKWIDWSCVDLACLQLLKARRTQK
jgi:hypothetical protein